MMRLSAATALYGLEQLQQTLRQARGGQDLMGVVDDFGATLEAMTGALENRLGDRERKTLGSVTELARRLVDPGAAFRAAGHLAGRSASALAEISTGGPQAEMQEPRPAARVL